MRKNALRSRVLYWDYYSKMAKVHNIDAKFIEAICLSTFNYLREAIESDEELKPIMLAYLGKFKLKKNFEKDKTKRWERWPQEELS